MDLPLPFLENNKLIRVLSLCDGIASGYEALKRLGYSNIEYHAIEIDETKRRIADANHLGIIRPSNDVIDYLDNVATEHYDLLLCGFTCTSLSSQGNRRDWDGDSKIFFDCVRILYQCKEVNPDIKFFFENVNSMRKTAKERISQELGVQPFVGNAGLVSLQDRIRLYWFNWETPSISPSEAPRTVLDPDGLALYTFSKSNRNKPGEPAIIEGRMKANRAGTLVTGHGCKGQSTMTQVITNKMQTRDLTVAECARLQGIGNYIWPCSDSKAYKAIGEGWQVDMIMQLFKEMD